MGSRPRTAHPSGKTSLHQGFGDSTPQARHVAAFQVSNFSKLHFLHGERIFLTGTEFPTSPDTHFMKCPSVCHGIFCELSEGTSQLCLQSHPSTHTLFLPNSVISISQSRPDLTDILREAQLRESSLLSALWVHFRLGWKYRQTHPEHRELGCAGVTRSGTTVTPWHLGTVAVSSLSSDHSEH